MQKPVSVVPAHGDFQKYVVELERDAAKNMGPAIEDIRGKHGERAANEILASTCALLSARAIAMIHVWNGEPIDRIEKRFNEAMKANIKPTITKIVQHLSKKEVQQ